ncbi:MAG: T9SS type A sorting domain-containing protein [Bacteroidetes bacterium]|nr:T9SS type A sorting domain-containing protein [Bacteroidota bacterium]
MRLSVIATIVMLLCVPAAHAQVSWTSTGNPVAQDFTGFTGAGLSNPAPAGGLSSLEFEVQGMSEGDCFFGTTDVACTAGDFARGSSAGGVSSGGMYAFDIGGGNVAVGFQPAGSDFTPGYITAAFTNSAGAITDVDLSFDLWVLNDQGRANSVNVSWSVDNVNFTPIASLDYVTTELADASPAWVQVAQSASIELGFTMQMGDVFYVRFSSDDVSGGGSRDEIALDNISTTPFANLAAEVVDFGAVSNESGVVLNWTTASENAVSGFEVQRAVGGGPFSAMGFVEAKGSGTYQFRSPSVDAGSVFRLRIVDVDGSEHFSNVLEVAAFLNESFVVGPAYPNPFATAAAFTVSVKSEQDVEVALFDVTGRRVQDLFSGRIAAGEQREVRMNGDGLAAGVYFYRVVGDRFQSTGRVMLTR